MKTLVIPMVVGVLTTAAVSTDATAAKARAATAAEIHLFNEKLISDENSLKADGRHLLKSYQGARLFAEVKDGKVAKYEATRNGKAIGVTKLRLESDGQPDLRPTGCYMCIIRPEGWACWEIDC